MILYREFDASMLDEVKIIFDALHWKAYLTDDEKLKCAFDRSLYLLGAFADDCLVGFVRCVGDGEHIVLVQDLVVRPDYQKKGIGTALFKAAWDRYGDVRMFMVVTDAADEVDNRFYKSFGMRKLEDGGMASYFR